MEPKAVPLAIVGIGCLFPKANNVDRYWTNIRDGVDAISEIPTTHWNPEEYFNEDKSAPDMTYARRGGFIDPVDFDPLLYGLSPNNIEATDTTQLLGMAVARQALLDAGYATAKDSDDGRQFDRDRTSVILGVTGTLELVIPLGARLGHPIWRKALADAGVDKDTAEDIVQRIADGYVPWQENSFPGLLGNVAAGRIANRFDLGGTNCVVDAACASSLSAVHMAAMELYAGRSDMAITGGFDTFNDIFMYMCFSKTPALSPTGNSKPFDLNGDGTILGEGLGAVILKRLDDAKRDGDQIYAVLKGIGSSSDGKGNAIYAPNAKGQVKALNDAYDQAGVTPRSIELLEAHGTGTKVGDAVEATALSEVYREDQQEGSWCAIGSVKSMIGHTKAAAGIAGMIKVAMALNHKVLPPTIKVEQPLEMLKPGSAPVYVNANKRPWISKTDHPRRAALSAFGFGGSNFHCVLEEVEQAKAEIEWEGKVILFSFSADSVDELKTTLAEIDHKQDWLDLRAEASRSLKTFDVSRNFRLMLVVTEQTQLEKMLGTARTMLDQGGDKTFWSTPDGVYFGSGEQTGKLAMLFPGQGSQYTNMLLDLACQFPQMQAALVEAESEFSSRHSGQSLNDLIYPIEPFSDEARRQNEEELRATQHAQPAIGAVSIGAAKILQDFGVKADVTAGHSFGELSALSAAGVIDEIDLHKLAIKRGELMQAKAGDQGSMLAVSASAAVVHEFLEGEPLDLIIANNNGPAQVVLSGATDQIDLALTRLKERGVAVKKLPVSAAFHSIYVADAEKPLAEFLQSISFNQSDTSVYANTTSKAYPPESEKCKAILAGQLAKPVEFVAQIENMFTDGIDTFIEVGPGKTLSALVSSILGEKKHHAIALDASKGKRDGEYDLACLLAQISVLGHALEIGKWDAGYLDNYVAESDKPESLMTISLSGANYVKPRPQREVSATKPVMKIATSSSAPTVGGVKPEAVETSAQSAIPASQAGDVMRITQQSILALQKMQEQTAQLHKQYLLGQQASQQTIQELIQQQRAMLTGGAVTPTSMPQVASAVETPVSVTVADVPVVKPVMEAIKTAVADATETRVSSNEVASTNKGFDYEALLLEVVADKTGYPVDMLSMDMSLDTDLGIDSIKRVEILSALQEKLPGVSTIQPEDLGTFQMLKHIVEFLAKDAPIESVSDVSVQANPAVVDTRLQEVLLEVVADKTGYPADMLNLDMNMDTDLGIDSIKRVEILSAFQEQMPEAPTVNPEDLASLQTLQQIVDFMQSSMPAGEMPATAVVAIADTRFEEVLLTVVADKTGYPADMLNLDMNMDTDLGIDSIKRVEILSAFQDEMPEAPTVNPEDLASLQTLGQIVEFMQGQTESAPVVTSTTVEAAVTGTPVAKLQEVLLEVVADKTGYPVDMLNLDMNMDTDLGIDSIKRVEILSAFQEQMPEAPTVNPEDLANLQTLQQIVDHMAFGIDAPAETVVVKEPEVSQLQNNIYRSVIEAVALTTTARKPVDLAEGSLVLVSNDGSDLAEKICTALEKRKLHAKIISLDEVPDVDAAGLILLAPANADNSFLLSAFQLLQRASASLKKAESKGSALLAGVTRLGGNFGFEHLSGANPVSGGLAGLIKTADKEWPDIHCKAIDIAANRSSVKLASTIVEEVLNQGPLETGIKDESLYQLALTTNLVVDKKPSPDLFDTGDVVIITGGARGVTAEVAVAMADNFHTNLLLVGRSPLPDQEAEWLQGLQEEAAIKKAIIEHSEGDKPSLAKVEESYKQILASREIRNNISRMQESGVQVSYQSIDIRDRDAVTELVKNARKEFGNVAGIIHGAGVLADKLIEDKTEEQFQQVYSTKIDGIQNLLLACEKDKLKTIVMFSSSTARLGRKGQVDYAMANEVLNKIAQQQQLNRPDCRVLSVNWGPWDGGMVTPQLKKLFESEGVGVIPLQAGADFLVQEISSEGPVEVMLLGSEMQFENASGEQDSVLNESLHFVSELQLSINDYPVLESHIMNGKAVLPAALIAEWLAHGAMHNHPGLAFIGFNDFRVLKGVVLDADEKVDLQIMAGQTVIKANEDLVIVELRSGTTLHARAVVVLGTDYAEPGQTVSAKITGAYPFNNKEYYENAQLFHGPALQCVESISACSANGISGKVMSAPSPSEWMSQPMRSSWLADPMILDASFQMMILWSFQHSDSASLPTRISAYRQFQRKFPKEGINLDISLTNISKHAATATIEIFDKQKKLLARIEGYECVIDASLNEAFKRNTIEISAKA
ncbi:MAG: SDR family NAD(P)-dependent oxidoreductase [Gammaproteobacteria bacterium]|nr:SDR family NAD(P)-dependent oxidoreductase [Gammaproteobacteria bacterium]